MAEKRCEETAVQPKTTNLKWFDTYTKVLLTVMVVLLLFIFGAGKYMASHQMEAGGTDDTVNTLATDVTHGDHHPFAELPGDAQVGAFSVANFFAGLIIGHHWELLFGRNRIKAESEAEAKSGGGVKAGSEVDFGLKSGEEG